MHIRFSTLAVAASILASPYTANALSETDIPTETPVSSLLSSAQSHLSRGETSEALVYYDVAVARDPSNYLTFFKRATTYLSLGRTNQATDDFNKVLALKPGFEGAHVQLAKIRTKAGDWHAAREQYILGGRAESSREVVELDEAEGASRLGTAAEQGGDWEGCVSHLSAAIILAPRAASLRESRAHCRLELGVLEAAITDMQHLLHLKPGDVAPHLKVAAMAFYSLGDLETGLGQTRKCLQSDPDSKPCKKIFRQQKSVDKGLEKASKALQSTKPMTAVKILVGSGDETGLLTEIEEQIKDLREGGLLPANGPMELHKRVLEMICQAYYEMNSKKASQFCRRVLEMNEESFYGLLQQGKESFDSEDYEAAVRTFERAAEVRPDKQGLVRPLLDKARIALKRSKTKDYYKVLGVAHDADERQIKSAYRKASKQFHPDKAAHHGLDKQEAERKMAAINEAYEVISDPELRARFDRGDDPNDQSAQSNPFQGSPFQGGGHPFFFQNAHGGGQKFQFNYGF